MDARETMYQVLTGANAVLNWIGDNFTDAELLRFALALVACACFHCWPVAESSIAPPGQTEPIQQHLDATGYRGWMAERAGRCLANW